MTSGSARQGFGIEIGAELAAIATAPKKAATIGPGLLAPIDTSHLSNWPDVLDVFKNAPISVINGKRVYIPEDWGPTSIIIETDVAPVALAAKQPSHPLSPSRLADTVSQIR